MLIIGLQVMIIFVGGRAFSISPDGLDGTQWAISIVTGFICIPWAVAIRYFPDAWFAVIARVASYPVLVVYGWLVRVCGAVGGLFRKKKGQDAEKDGEMVAAPAIVVVDDAASSAEKQV